MAQLFALSARSALAAGITSTSTSMTVDASTSDLFPVANTGTGAVGTDGLDWFKVILEDADYNKEVVYVRTRVLGSAIMTNLLRGQEGTTARSFLGGSVVGLRHTAVDLQDAIEFASDPRAELIEYTPAGEGATITNMQARLRAYEASGGSALVGYQPGGVGAVATTVQSKLRESVSALDFGVVGGGTANDTTAIQAALDSGTLKVILPAGIVFGVTSLTMAQGQTLVIDGTLKKLSGTSPIITANSKCKVIGDGEIDGNSVASADAIYAASKSDVLVADLYIHHVGGKAINLISTPKSKVIGNRIENITGQAVELTFSDGSIVSSNYIDTALHGVQFWGGDSALYPGTYTYDISISGNIVKNVMGGIWGSQGQRISVVGNNVSNCTDVGIDFEGGVYCTASGNTVTNCNNGGLALFYASSFCSFNGNTVYANATTGNKYGIWLTDHAHNNCSFDGNVIRGAGSNALINVGEGSYQHTFSGNQFSGGGCYLGRLYQSVFTSNSLIDSKLQISGGRENIVTGNTIVRASAINASTQNESPLYVTWANSSFNAQRNTITNNVVLNWSFPIVDDCWGDNSSFNDCSYNRVSGSMYHRETTGWYGRMEGNVLMSNPNTAATILSY